MSRSRKSSSSPGNESNGSVTSPQSAVNEGSFPSHDQESLYPDERTSLSAISSYLLEDRNASRTGPENTSSHLQVSSFNYPVNLESTLLAPTSIPARSPSISSHTLAVRPRSETPVHSYQPYGTLYSNTVNPPRTSGPEETGYSSFPFYENDVPEPYWGNFNISATPTTTPPARHRSGLVPIAPHPRQSPNVPKRQLDDDDSQRSRKRPSVTTYPAERRPQELSPEEQLLVHLKEVLKLPWKDITARWAEKTGKPKQEAALQMQYKRLKERIRVWTTADVMALSRAIEKVGSMKWESISQAMLDYGIQEKWTRQACQQKWESLEDHELEMIKRLDRSPSRQYNNSNSLYSSRSSATPNSRSGSGYGEGVGVAPSQLVISYDYQDNFLKPHNRYVSQCGSSYMTQGV